MSCSPLSVTSSSSTERKRKAARSPLPSEEDPVPVAPPKLLKTGTGCALSPTAFAAALHAAPAARVPLPPPDSDREPQHSLELKLLKTGFMNRLQLVECLPLQRVAALQKLDWVLATWPEEEDEGASPKPPEVRQQTYDNEIAQLSAYLKSYSSLAGGMVVTYKKAPHGWGRCYPEAALGLTSFRRLLRNTLIRGLYSDFDIVNCHVEILRLLMTRLGHKCPYLTNLCEHRAEWFDRIGVLFEDVTDPATGQPLNRDAIKKLFITLIFGGTFDSWAHPLKINPMRCPEDVASLTSELARLADVVMRANPILRRVAEKLNGNNVRGSCLSLFLQEHETRIVGAVLERVIKDGRLMTRPGCPSPVGTYEYDGLKLLDENVQAYGGPQKVVEYLERITLQTSGLPLKWSAKPLDPFVALEWNAEQTVLPDPAPCVRDHAEAALAVLRQFPHWKVCNKKLWSFDSRTGMWTDNADFHEILVRRCQDSLALVTNPVGRPSASSRIPESRINLATDPAHLAKVLHMIRSVPPEQVDTLLPGQGVLLQDPEWLLRTSNTSVGQLLFSNGVYHSDRLGDDGQKGRFVPVADTAFSPHTVFHARFPFPYEAPDAAMTERITLVRQKLFTDQYEAQAPYLLQILGLALFAIPLKRFVIVVGKTNSGKSILTKALQAALGDLAGTFTGESLVRRKGSTTDDAANLRWALNLQNKRIVFSNEMTRSVPLDGTYVKRITGGDVSKGRDHYEGEQDFVFRALPILFCNDIPSIEDVEDAVSGRLWPFSIERRYADVPDLTMNELKRDPLIENWIQEPDTRLALLHLLIQSARECGFAMEEGFPECIRANREEWLPASKDGSVSILLAAYELTGNLDHFVPQSEVVKFFKDQKATMSVAKICQDLRYEVKKRRLTAFEYGYFHIGGKKLRGFKGLQLREDPDEVRGGDNDPIQFAPFPVTPVPP